MRILAVDDDPMTLAPLEQRLLGESHEVRTFGDGEAAWAALEEGYEADVLILDWMLPGMDGLELLRRIRGREEQPYVYIIMLTGRRSPADLVEGFEAGADDYLRKPVDWDELDARLRAGERIVNLQRALIEAREELRTQAMQDALTGILNHGAIMDALEREVNRADREGSPLSVVLADLDKFKRVNDNYGHLAGDHVLVEMARRMRGCLRSYDAIGRYGGEEFLLVLPNSGPQVAKDLAERIRAVVVNTPFELGNGSDAGSVRMSLSLGVVTLAEPRALPAQELIRVADRALYDVKDQGGDGVAWEAFPQETQESGEANREPVS